MLQARLRLLLLIAVVGAAVPTALVLWRELSPASSTTQVAGTPAAAMSLSVTGAGAVCDDPLAPASCSLPVTSVFTLIVAVDSLPVDPSTQLEAGYVGLQAEVFLGDLRYELNPIAGNEVSWPEGAFPVRSPFVPLSSARLIAYGDISSVTPPLPPSPHTGSIVELSLRCSDEPGVFDINLLAYNQASRPLGSGFRLLNQSGGLGAKVPANVTGQKSLDLDGDAGTAPQNVDVSATLEIDCAPLPTITPGGPTLTPTRTRTPTRTPTITRTPTQTPAPPDGDVNCDGPTNSIDAVLVLQLTVGLLPSLQCEPDGDVNRDQSVDAVDAALILQFTAGLIPSLPV